MAVVDAPLAVPPRRHGLFAVSTRCEGRSATERRLRAHHPGTQGVPERAADRPLVRVGRSASQGRPVTDTYLALGNDEARTRNGRPSPAPATAPGEAARFG